MPYLQQNPLCHTPVHPRGQQRSCQLRVPGGLAQALDQTRHALEVGAAPVDLIAGGAAAEFVVLLAHARRQAVENIFSGNGDERAVAADAAGEGVERGGQIEATADLDKLRLWGGGVDEGAVADVAALE